MALALVGSCLASRAALGAEGRAETVPAEMLLELDVLSDDRFAASPTERDREDAARTVEVLDGLDGLDPENEGGTGVERESTGRKR